MIPLDQFMREYFRERTETVRTEIARREPFRQKYYAADCHFDSRRESVAQSEVEDVLSITSRDTEAEVITTGFGSARSRWRLRYHLQSVGDRWIIKRADM